MLNNNNAEKKKIYTFGAWALNNDNKWAGFV